MKIRYGNLVGDNFSQVRVDNLAELAKLLAKPGFGGMTPLDMKDVEISYDPGQDYTYLRFTVDERRYSIRHYKSLIVSLGDESGFLRAKPPGAHMRFGTSAADLVVFFCGVQKTYRWWNRTVDSFLVVDIGTDQDVSRLQVFYRDEEIGSITISESGYLGRHDGSEAFRREESVEAEPDFSIVRAAALAIKQAHLDQFDVGLDKTV